MVNAGEALARSFEMTLTRIKEMEKEIAELKEAIANRDAKISELQAVDKGGKIASEVAPEPKRLSGARAFAPGTGACKKCNGAGVRRPRKHLYQCKYCHGTGVEK